jgi:hypothetical protein
VAFDEFGGEGALTGTTEAVLSPRLAGPSFVSALSTVHGPAVPVVLLAFALTWFLREIRLRGHADTAVEPVEPAVSI